MTVNLQSFRLEQGWNQQELARRLRVSQTLVSLWEQGQRAVPAKRFVQLKKLGMKMSATTLPMRDLAKQKRVDYTQELSNLGYPGFAHFKTGEPNWNPAQLLVQALSERSLDRRVAEALPWLAMRYSEMDWNWVQREAKLRNLQNRLGFTLALGKKLADRKQDTESATRLEKQEQSLQDSLLAKEDTYCYDSMTLVERKWLLANRSQDAAAWHVLSDLDPADFVHM
jgi:transcriptional regulator with XRE-family HTH domain